MKRLMHILLAIQLSVTIILMGSGLMVVHCNHTGNTRIVTFDKACEKNCNPNASCMKTTILKFSTMSQTLQQSLEHVLPIVFLPWLPKPLFEVFNLFTNKQEAVRLVTNHRHGPPRTYLNFICVLLI